jgi:hypothetical protein
MQHIPPEKLPANVLSRADINTSWVVRAFFMSIQLCLHALKFHRKALVANIYESILLVLAS